MFLWLWQFLRGFVTIEVTGFSVERFINMAIYKGIYLWDVSHSPEGVRMKVSVKGFRMLRECARKTKCRMRIAGKTGSPFILYRYRKRKILVGGMVFFVVSLYALSSFVWQIEIQGQERLSTDEILAFCESRGLKIGAFKYTIGTKRMQQELITQFTDISWIDVHIKGTRATIRLAEIIPKQPLIDRETPCHIVAAKDGLISGIVTGAGKPLVKQNDVVRQGEMLVSGMLEMNSELVGPTVAYVHAYAEVWAKMYTRIQCRVPLEYSEKTYTGRVKKYYSLQLLLFGGKNIGGSGSSIRFDNYDRITYRRQWGVSGDYPLPLIWVTTAYREFTPTPRSRTTDEAKELAERMITGRILREFDFQADIIDKQITYTETQGEIIAEALITTNERIDMAVPLE